MVTAIGLRHEKWMGLHGRKSQGKSGSHYMENLMTITGCHVIMAVKCHVITVGKERNEGMVDISNYHAKISHTYRISLLVLLALDTTQFNGEYEA